MTRVLSELSCPVCRSTRVIKSDYVSIVEHMILRVVQICPFVCQVCSMRFYMFLVASGFRRPEALRAWHEADRNNSSVSLT
jgi:hypothetical protein